MYHLQTLEKTVRHSRAVGLVIRVRYELFVVWGFLLFMQHTGAQKVRYKQTRGVVVYAVDA